MDFVYRPEFEITRKLSVSETGSVSVLREREREGEGERETDTNSVGSLTKG
jgi:hypothetical protein